MTKAFAFNSIGTIPDARQQPPAPIQCMLPDSQLISLAGKAAFARGRDYLNRGRVRLTRVSKIALGGEAYGTETYALWWRRQGEDRRHACACRAAEDGSFCKHLVAAALAWRTGERERQPVNAHDELLDYLRAQPAERLAGWLRELADADRDVEKRLRLYRAAEDPAELRKALGKMLNAAGFLDYRASLAYARKLDVAVAQVARLLQRDAAACRVLCEYALGRLFKIYRRCDDSGGAIGERMAALADLHVRACKKAVPDGKAFARDLHALQALDEWGLLPLDRYWPVLDSSGQYEYRRLVLAELDCLPEQRGKSHRYGDSSRIRAQAETLARLTQDF